MSRILVLSVIVASLSTIVGCGGSAHGPHAATPASVNVAEARDEASWTPPEEMAMQIKDGPKAETVAASERRLESSYRPNRNERPTAGAVHAATY
jgi:hypothetical protein